MFSPGRLDGPENVGQSGQGAGPYPHREQIPVQNLQEGRHQLLCNVEVPFKGTVPQDFSSNYLLLVPLEVGTLEQF